MYEFIDYQVRDVMTPDPVSITSDVLLAEAEAIFEKNDFNGLPVVDQNNRPTGFLTKLDLLKAFIFTEKAVMPDYRTIMGQSISQVMTKKVDTVRPETPLTSVLQKMTETRNKSFPVVEKDRIIGIVAREDVLKALRLAAKGRKPVRLA
jgi:CBS domain-containing protein